MSQSDLLHGGGVDCCTAERAVLCCNTRSREVAQPGELSQGRKQETCSLES